jgi:integrase
VEDYKRLITQVGRKPATINRQLAFVRHLFNYAKRCNKFYANNPVSIAGLLPVNNQRTRILTLEEDDLVLNNAEEPMKSMIQIALLTGLRMNSIRTLTWKCIDLNSNRITVESIYSKNKKIHFTHICNTVRKVLPEAKLRSGKSEYVFPEAMALSDSGVGDRFTRLCTKLGIRGLRFHDLRHTCGTRLAEIGYDVGAISKVLGHSSITMSMRYVHPKDSIKKAMEDLANYKTLATSFTTSEKLYGPK